jgi:hypothetical protein
MFDCGDMIVDNQGQGAPSSDGFLLCDLKHSHTVYSRIPKVNYRRFEPLYKSAGQEGSLLL